MEKIGVIGAGGLGKDVLFLLEAINQLSPTFDIIGFFDDNLDKGDNIGGYEVLGNTDDLNSYNGSLNIVFAIGKVDHIDAIFSKIRNDKIKFPNIIHPSCYIDFSSLSIGRGNVFNIGTIVSKDVSVGDFNIFNTKVALGHDAVIGSFNHFGPNVQISGGVKIGDYNNFGLNSSVIQYKRLGNWNSVGASSLLIKNLADHTTVFGVPAVKYKL